jgi:hypothetical protein
MALSLLALLGLGPVALHRLDPVVSLLLVGALAAALAGRPLASGVVLGLAAGAKLFPLLLAPLFFLCWQGRARLSFGCGLLLTTLALFVPLDGQGLELLLRFHAQRPVQLESTYAGVMLADHLLRGTPLKVLLTHGAYGLTGPYQGLLQPLSTGLTLAATGLVALLFGRLPPGQRRAWLPQALVAGVLAVLVGGRVLSPQYLVWLFPLALLLRPPVPGLLVGACFLTQLIFPVCERALLAFQPAAVLLLWLRNGLLAGVLVYLLAGLGRAARTP